MKYWILAAAGLALLATAIAAPPPGAPYALLASVAGGALLSLILARGPWQRPHPDRARQFEVLAEASNDGKAIVRDGLIIYANPALEQLLATTTPALTGSRFVDYLEDAGPDGWPQDGERRVRAADGSLIPVQMRTTVADVDGQTLQLVFLRDIRQQLAAAEQIRALNEYMDSIIDNADIWLNTLDQAGRIVIWNQAAERISGYSREDVVGRSDIWAQLYPDAAYRDYVFSRAMDILEGGSVALNLVTTIRNRFGRQVTLSWNSRMLTNSRGEAVGSIALARDVTLERQAQESLRLHASVFETLEPIAITTPEGIILRVNRAFGRMFGYTDEEVAGQSLRKLHLATQDDDPHSRIWQHLASADQWSGELTERCGNGELLPVQLTLSAVRDDQGTTTHYVGHWQDISERKAFEEQIQRQAFYDPLTGLPNRRLALNRLTQELGRSRRIGGYGALLFLDLDRFKHINDLYGHTVGDVLLVELARRLQSVLRTEDLAARLGGDEFVILVGAESGDRDAALIRAERIAEKVLDSIRRPATVGGYQLSVSASAGLAIYPEEGTDAEQLLQRADTAMYRAKERGRDGIHFFSADLQERARQRQVIHKALDVAMDKAELRVDYQPIVDSRGNLKAVEALVRWESLESLGLGPGDLIAVAEQTGMIARVDRFVLQTACDQLAQWGRLGLLPETCALMVNLSYPLLMQEPFAAELAQILERTGMPTERLLLDIEDGIFQDQHPGLTAAMESLGDLGVHFAVDDFGAGHSSLAQLKQLPVRAIKLARDQVRGLPGDTTHVAVLEACLAIGQSLGLDVVAKGVETARQFQALRERGCPFYQGYHLSPPLVAADLETLFRQGGRIEPAPSLPD